MTRVADRAISGKARLRPLRHGPAGRPRCIMVGQSQLTGAEADAGCSRGTAREGRVAPARRGIERGGARFKRTNVRTKGRQIRALGVVEPELDTEKLARVLIIPAEHLAKEKAEGKKGDAVAAA